MEVLLHVVVVVVEVPTIVNVGTVGGTDVVTVGGEVVTVGAI